VLRTALANLPPTLDATYERILYSIKDIYSEYALRILRWVAFSTRPLLVEEVAEVVAIDIERDLAFHRDEVLIDPLDVLKICRSLIATATAEPSSSGGWNYPSRSAREVVVLAHYSVKEYLISERIRKGPAARYSMQPANCNEFIAKSCLGYLLQFQESGHLSNKCAEESKLARYSAEFWITHAQAASQKAEALNRLIMKHFSAGNGAYLNWIRIHNPDRPWDDNYERKLEEVPTPLYYASLSGLTEIVRLLTFEDEGADVNAQGGGFGNALQAASSGGHTAIVELLLGKGADVNAPGGHFGNALQAASSEGHTAIVELLLSKGAL
jgi:hypothetical protein